VLRPTSLVCGPDICRPGLRRASLLITGGSRKLLRSSGSRRDGPAETLGPCSSSCSKPSGKRFKSGRSGLLRQNFRTETDRFSDSWTRVLRVRDREAPGSNPGPPTNCEFKIRDSGGRPEAVRHSRITDSWGSTHKRTVVVTIASSTLTRPAAIGWLRRGQEP
jgi:hypothetical protein